MPRTWKKTEKAKKLAMKKGEERNKQKKEKKTKDEWEYYNESRYHKNIYKENL